MDMFLHVVQCYGTLSDPAHSSSIDPIYGWISKFSYSKIILWNEMSRMSLKLCWIVDFYYLYPDAIAMGMVRIYARFLY